jgi:hypothetical protein
MRELARQAVALVRGLASLGRALRGTIPGRRRRLPVARLLGAACEACTDQVQTTARWSFIEQRDVGMCDWCARRFDKLNSQRSRRMDIPRGKRRKGGNRV